MYGRLAQNSPSAAAITSDPVPEPKPLITTISSGFLEESFQVQLFSNPQNTHASNTKNDPAEKEKLL